MMKNPLKYLVLWALTTLSQTGFALALSDLELNSHLNQTLSARVNMSALSQEEMKSLNVTVIGMVGGEKGQQIPLNHKISQDENGNYIKITSRDAIREPIITLLLEVSWSAGQLSRKYPIIIDPQ